MSVLCGAGCNPQFEDGDYIRWFVMNLTDENITVDVSCWRSKAKEYEVTLSPGKSVPIHTGRQPNAVEVAKMEDLFEYAKNPHDWFFSVIKDGKVVRKWSASDLDEEGHQFPKAEYWKRNINTEFENRTYVDWTFYIFPKDLVR